MKLSRREFGPSSLLLALSMSLVSMATAPQNHSPVRWIVRTQDRQADAGPCSSRFPARTLGSSLSASAVSSLLDDNGRSWRQADVPASVTLTTDVSRTQRMVGQRATRGFILHTRDGGATWQRVFDGRAAANVAFKAAKAIRPPTSRTPNISSMMGPTSHSESGGAVRRVRVGARCLGLAFVSHDEGASWASQMTRIPNPMA